MTAQNTRKTDEYFNYIAYAEQMAAANNARLTPIRKHIYKCLVESDTPLGAYDILDMLDGIGSSKPPTVYRGLDWLIEVGLAARIESISKYIAKTSSNDAEATALLLCETCGHAESFDASPVLESLGQFAKSMDFQGEQTVIEIIGKCSEHKTRLTN